MQRARLKASKIRPSGSQISLYGNGWCDRVQAPLILIAMLGCAAKASTFGNSAKGCGGAGGSRRLLQTEMIDHQLGVEVSRRQLPGLLQAPGTR